MSLSTHTRPTQTSPLIDISLPKPGPLLTELINCYLTLHPKRRQWRVHERDAMSARVELRRTKPSLRPKRSQSASVHVFIEHAGGSHGPGYVETSPFLIAEGKGMAIPGFLSKLPCLAHFIESRLRSLEESLIIDPKEIPRRVT